MQCTNWFDSNMKWGVEFGEKVKLWEDVWVDNIKLKARFPRLFNNSLIIDNPLRHFGKWNKDNWVWEFKWRREWFEWEKAQVVQFKTVLEGQTLKTNMEDKWLWRDLQTCKYSVKFAYAIVSNSIPSASKDMYRVLWGLLVPPSTQCFVWRALHNRIVTKQNLIRRSVHLADSLCVLCGTKEKTPSHLFLTCQIASIVWNCCSKWIEVRSVIHFSLKEQFEQFHCPWLSKEDNKLWK